MKRKFMVPTGTAWMEMVEVECSSETDIDDVTIEEIAAACVELKKGNLIPFGRFTDEEMEEMAGNGIVYVDLTPYGHDCYMFEVYGLREIKDDE